MTDFRYALRTLLRNRAFTLTAALTLALGIGATTAIFSVVKAVVLEPLPYRDPARLVVTRLSLPDYRDVRSGTVDRSSETAAGARISTTSRPADEDRQVLGAVSVARSAAAARSHACRRPANFTRRRRPAGRR